ncbi:MAG: ABC transporter permease [Candidatus Wallbacteria bacterium]|nr:ABC transporter permease [Candidatus Wallbacteria bacterium]
MRAIPLRYNLRSLRVRWLTTTLTVGGVALVVATFVALMALASGFSHAIGGAANPRNVVLLYRGGLSEAMSRVSLDSFQALRFLPQIATNERGDPLASLESLVQINCERKSGGETMVILRGMRAIGFQVHDTVRLAEGEWFRPGSSTCVVGKGIAERNVGCHVGDVLNVGRMQLRIVGVLSAGGGALESEIWGDLDDVVNAAHRDWYNSVTVRLRAPGLFEDFARVAGTDPRIDLGAKTEAHYLAEQAEGAEGFRIIGLIVAVFMAIGASLAEMNTMYSAVGTRTREIGTLRALGFRGPEILKSFLAESVMLAIPGGILGCLAGGSIDGFTMSLFSMATVSEVSFHFQVTPLILTAAFVFSVAIGLLGGMLPALQAARLPVLEALRKV